VEAQAIQSGFWCGERERLREHFVQAMREMVDLQAQQTQAVIDNDDDFMRFDDLILMARLAKDEAKYALLAHLSDHRCDGASHEKGE
jgi:hypothetical protein